MTKADYAFVTHWEMPAPIERVWEAIIQTERWPDWWHGLQSVVELKPGDANRLGAIQRFAWKGILPYMLVVEMRVTRVERPRTLESEASGELEGRGRWSLLPSAVGTHVRYDWMVRTTKPWMNRFAPLARPLFAWNHHVVMRGGERGLRRWLPGGE